jgi:hypothetical protein
MSQRKAIQTATARGVTQWSLNGRAGSHSSAGEQATVMTIQLSQSDMDLQGEGTAAKLQKCHGQSNRHSHT